VAATEPRPAEGTFAEIEPEIVDDDPSDVGLSDARQLLAQGRSRDALALVQSLPGLTARVVEAQALRALGELNAALDVLRQATNSAAEDDPAYPEALFDLATIYLATGKQRSAMRLLEEVRDLAPAFRPGDIAATLDELQNSSR
jgi:thioredoxin-like negative regulator of GroEL